MSATEELSDAEELAQISDAPRLVQRLGLPLWRHAQSNSTENPALKARRWSLRTRLSLALLLVFLPIFGLVTVSHLQSLKERRDSRIESLATIDQTLAASFDGFARDLETFALSASITLTEASAAGLPLDQQTFGTYFSDLANSYHVRSIFITDLNGKVLAGTAGNVGFDVSTRPYFLALKNGAKTTWSGALAGQESGQTTLAYGTVVRAGNGSALAYLIIAFYPPLLADRLPTDLPADAEVSLIDNGGIVLLNSREPDPDTPTVDVSSSSAFKAAAAGNNFLIRGQTTPIDTDRRYGAFVPIKATGWVVGITRPVASIDGPLASRFRRELLLVGAAFIAGLAAMLFIASRLSRPLTTLAASAAAIARGAEPSSLPSPSSDSEVFELQQAMQTMSEAITERENALRQETRSANRLANQLQRLHTSRNALSSLLPPDQVCAIVVNEAANALEAKAGSVLLPREDANTFRVAAQIGYSEAVLRMLDTMPLGQPSPFWDAYNGQEAVTFSRPEDQILAYPHQTELKTRAETQATAFLPLQADNRVLGVLSLGFNEPRSFSKVDIDLMFAFANQAAQALHRSQLFAAEQMANEQLRKANSAKDDFLGLVSHELKSPLTTIIGGTNLLSRPARGLTTEEGAPLAADIHIAALRLNRVIDGLLVLARFDKGAVVEVEPLALSGLISQVVQEMAPTSTQEIATDVEGDLPLASGNGIYVEQVFRNLISNAQKYSPPASTITVSCAKNGTNLLLRVADEGEGITSEESAKVFEAFYRSSQTATAPGIGIGLAVAHTLVEAMGGSIWCEPNEPKGTRFCFTLPVAPEDAPL